VFQQTKPEPGAQRLLARRIPAPVGTMGLSRAPSANFQGNRRVALMLTDDQTVCRRFRLTERLAVAMFETVTPEARVTRGMENGYDDDAIGLNNVEHGERKATN
jgi:hypothetical protein